MSKLKYYCRLSSAACQTELTIILLGSNLYSFHSWVSSYSKNGTKQWLWKVHQELSLHTEWQSHQPSEILFICTLSNHAKIEIYLEKGWYTCMPQCRHPKPHTHTHTYTQTQLNYNLTYFSNDLCGQGICSRCMAIRLWGLRTQTHTLACHTCLGLFSFGATTFHMLYIIIASCVVICSSQQKLEI